MIFQSGKKVESILKREEENQLVFFQIGMILAHSLDREEILLKLSDLTVPAFADWLVVDLLAQDKWIFQRRIFHSDPAKAAWAEEVGKGHPPDMNAAFGPPEVARTGKPLLVSHVTPEYLQAATKDVAFREALKQMGLRSYLSVPLFARGQTIGTLTFLATESGESRKTYGEEELKIAQKVAARSALAIENSRLFEEAKRAVKFRDDLLGTVAHNLLNSLSAIGMSATLLSREFAKNQSKTNESAAQIKQVDIILKSSARMNRLIADLLDLTRIKVGKLQLQIEEYEAETLLNEVLEAFESLAAADDIQISHQAISGPCRILCDHERIMQVFSNLIGNAIKFTPKGGEITLGLDIAETEAFFSVTDTGCGIPGDDLSHVFDRFWQATKTARKGTGLGLSIV